MKKPGNSCLAAALAALFNSNNNSDCFIQFVIEPLLDRPSKRVELADGGAETPAKSPDLDDKLGEPLHGHTFVLRYASDWFRAKLDDLQLKEEQAASLGDGAAACTAPSRPHPVLRVPLGSAEEVFSARAAIQYAYTGELQVGTIREVLEVLRQAGYLQVQGCAAACTEVVKAKLTESQGREEAGGRSDTAPPVLEFYVCKAIWPDSSQEPAFTDAITSAKPLLVRYFGDAISVLNTPSLRQQLLALPAVAVEALLESDDFGTDTEDSVLLLLATWVQENRDKMEPSTRERLCGLVRLAQLSKPYAVTILPALALDFKSGAEDGKGPGWFPIDQKLASVFSQYASTSNMLEREQLERASTGLAAPGSAWFNKTPRRLVTSDVAFEWRVTQDDLKEALSELEPGEAASVYGTFCNSSITEVYSRGFWWWPEIMYREGDSSAGVFLSCGLPSVYKRDGSVLNEGIIAVAELSASFEVYRWRNIGGREVVFDFRYALSEDFIVVDGEGWGRDDALPLQPPGGGMGGLAGQLSGWAEYLRNDMIHGRLTLLPTPPSPTTFDLE